MKVLCEKPVSDLKCAIDALDLDPIKFKLMHPDGDRGWSREYADIVERQYRNFLFLSVTSQIAIVPTKDIDDFWHAHILDTAKYFKDCEKVFGFYLHHFPYFGIRSDEDEQCLQTSFRDTQQLWHETFGEPMAHSGSHGETCGVCGGSCTACSAIIPGHQNDVMQSDWRPSL